MRLKNKNIRRFDENYFYAQFKRSKKWNAKDEFIYIRSELMENIRKFYPRNGYYLFDSLAREKRFTAYGKLRYWVRQAVGAVRNLDEEELQGVGFHITRRTFMTVGVTHGFFSFEQGSKNLGHSSVKITEKHYLFLRKNPYNSIVNYFKAEEKRK